VTSPLRTLLLVEDSPEDRGTYRAFLREDGECDYTFLEAEDAEEALELCRTHEVDCVLLDYHLPGMNGLEFLERLRGSEDRPVPPVVMLTGRGSERTAVQALKAGADDYLVKSDVTPPSLFRAVHNALERGDMRRRIAAQASEQQHLMAEHQRLAAVVANAASFIAFATMEGQVLYINEAGRRLMGLGPDEDVTHLTRTELYAPEDLALRETVIHPALLREGRWRGEFRLRHQRTGALIPVQHDIFLLPAEKGEPVRVASVSQDITELKHQQQAAQERADFEQYLAGIVGHDLRNPINAITLSAAMMLRRQELDERLRAALKRILNSAERTHRLIDTTLDFTQARLGGGLRVERKPLDLHALTRQVVDEVQLSFPGRHLEVSHEGDGTGAWDPDRMAQVLTNLLTNALKYSPENTPVKVRTRGQEHSLTLEVHNLGSPIPAELLPRLFAPLKRGKEGADLSGRSLGLGLYIVDHIVRAHGGTVEVRSQAEEGTAFMVRLPRTQPT
jgi:PAS domain S-box-containing protein